jgi:hypothetical protein
MRGRGNFPELPLWRNPQLLAGVTRPRVATAPFKGIPEDSNGKHQQQTILATEGVFHELAMERVPHGGTTCSRLVKAIMEKCLFLTDAWLWQDDFFSRLMTLFFAGCSERPAWIWITPQRLTIQDRQDHAFKVAQTALLPKEVGTGSKLWDHRLSLCGLNISCEGLLLLPKRDCPIRDTKIIHQQIVRDLKNTAGRIMFRTFEDWCYLSTGDKHDQADAVAARVPALGQFFDEASKIQFAPIISLVRLNYTGSQVDLLAFNLHPQEGKAVDFRAMIYPFEYCLRSNANSYEMLRRAVTPGCWDYL